MRIKWNRHLDGSSSRRPEDGTESQEGEVKKRGPSSSPSIFRIFRRKKSRKRGEDDAKADGGNGVEPPLEIDEEDCASISSVTTCASQPSTEPFQRDRASSLFSSFRLSLPGSKRKKRRIAPTPSETILNGQENEPQVERYSTPDLRKPTEKLAAPNSTQVSLSTSSPSIRQPPKGSSTSAQSLDLQRPEVQWVNSRSATSSTSKLSKSVSFSEDGSADFSHSKCDNKALRTMDCMAMVEEDAKALESELSACMSDNPQKSRLNNFTSVGDSLSFSSANASSLHKQPGGDSVGTADMTKTEDTGKRSSDVNEDNSISDINHILDDLASEIRCYEKSNEGLVKISPHESLVPSSVKSSYSNGYHNVSAKTSVLSDEKTDKSSVSVNLKSSVKHTETAAGKSPSQNTHPERSDDSVISLLCSERNGDIVSEKPSDKPSDSERPYFNILSANHVSKIPLNDTSKTNADGIISVMNGRSDDTLTSDRDEAEKLTPVEKQPVITNSKHLLCHVKVYESETPDNKSKDFKVFEKPVTKNCSESLTYSNIKTETNLRQNNFIHETKSEISDSSIFRPENPSVDNRGLNFSLKCDPLVNESSALNLKVENKHSYDQKVPEKEVPTHKYHIYQKDQEVPEFEQSLLEFEEVCNKYMSRSTPDFSDCSSIIPLNNNSPKRKSVLDLNFSFIYPNFHEKGKVEISSFNSVKDEVSPHSSEFNKQNIESKSEPNLEYLCQNVTEMSAFPLPPKQWINCGKVIENESVRGVCTDGEQCTTVRGKNLCQEPCLGALPTTVMLHDSDLEGIDTPQQSSTLQPLENKSGREHISIVATEKEQLSDDRQPSDNMISSVGITISSLNGVLDYSYAPKTSSKASVYFDPEIRETYRGPRAICDPLVYSTDATKGLESLGAGSYLNGHNFCDIRNVGLCEVINDVSCDYVQGGNGLIEISNPYGEETFILSQDFSHRNLVSASLPSDSLRNSEVCATIGSREDIKNEPSCNLNSETTKSKRISVKDINENPSEGEKLPTIDNLVENSCASGENILNELALKSNELSKENLNHSEQKNMINKTKSSMIPCRKKVPSNIETKRIETKLKSKKSNSFPRFIKSESHLPVKSDSSHRVLSKSSKDSDVGQIRGKQKDSSSNKPNGNHPGISPVNHCEAIKTAGNENHLNSTCENEPFGKSLEDIANEGNKISSIYSSYVILPADCTSGTTDDINNAYESSSIAIDTDAVVGQKNEIDDSNMVSSVTSSDNVTSIRELSTRDFVDDVTLSSKSVDNSDINHVEYATDASEIEDTKFTEFCLQCNPISEQDHTSLANIKCDNCLKTSECFQPSLGRSSLPTVGMRKTSITSSKESLNSQLTNTSNKGKSRIPRIFSKIKRSVSATFTTKRNPAPEQSGPRGAQPSTKGPVRPPMWLSKAELTQEIQRLGTLCEARTKELNRLKMETKHVSVGFDAFAALFKYMVEDLNALSVPALSEDLGKTLKQLELTKQDLAYYEREVEEMKSHHCQELNDLSNKLFEVYQSEVAELNAKHQEEINHLKNDHQKQIEHLTSTFDATSAESKAHHDKMIKSLEQEIINQREELQLFQEREIKDLEEKHAESSKLLHEHIEQLQKKCAELKQHSMSMEDAMRKDTDSKLQWVTAAKLDLEKEVESLKTVLEMKNKELHTLRVQNLEMEKQLEELPLAREKIKMLQARAEDLEALMLEKTKLERKLSTENQQIKDTYEKEAKVNRRLSMENEELLWRLRQAENSLISESFSKVPEFPEVEEENAATSPTKSPGPQMMSRSVFFTFVDKDESSSHSPRSQYKKITPGFSANYKTSPAKSSKSPPAPSPRRAKSHSEPPQPLPMTSTPRKVAKQALGKTKGSQKRQRSGSDSGRPTEHAEVNFSSVTESMASSVSSESSVFEHRERLLEEHKEHIIHSLEILREQRSIESCVDEPGGMEKKWCSDDIKIPGELSHLETEDMSRSAEFSDPKTYYHMTFPVLKESGIPDCDMDDSCKNLSSNGSPVKEIASVTMHSMSENNIKSAVEASDTLQVMSASSHAAVSTTVMRVENKRNSCSEATISSENVQREAASNDKTDNRWRTI